MCILTGDTWVCAAVCRFPCPTKRSELDNGHRRIQTEQQPPTGIYLLKDNDRVLVVEDELLVAMMMVEALVEMGLGIVGPFSNTADAIRAVKEAPVAAAILDINLGEELVYPVADLLNSRGIPFAFVTGYGSGQLDRRYPHAPVLLKPVDRNILREVFRKSGGTPQLIGDDARTEIWAARHSTGG